MGLNECMFERILEHIHSTTYCCNSSGLRNQRADSLRSAMAVQLSFYL